MPGCSRSMRTTGARPRVAARWRGVFPSRSRPLISMGESAFAVALDSTNSITGISAHCIARCNMDVPSVRALGNDSDDLSSSLSDGADCSLMALAMAVVSPLRSDSKTRNSFTDCSIDEAFAVLGEVGDGWKFGDEGLRPSAVLTLDMLAERCGRCFLERLRWWPGRCCDEAPRCEPAADEPGGEESLMSVLVTSFLEDTRPSMCLTFCDFDRLWLLGVSTASNCGCPVVTQQGALTWLPCCTMASLENAGGYGGEGRECQGRQRTTVEYCLETMGYALRAA